MAAIRRLLSERRVGHAGTLDPAATGLLVVLVGRATRLARFASVLPKHYRGTIRFGTETDSDDAEGAVTVGDGSWEGLEGERIRAALAEVAARPMQVPPVVSAKKVGGERAYLLARRGEAPDLAPVPVRVRRFEATRVALPDLDVEVECSTGTYVRALARDVGRALGTRAHLASLRRTGIGPWDVAMALPLEGASPESARAALRPMAEALAHLPVLVVDAEVAARVRHGGRIAASEGLAGPVVVTSAGEVLAVAEYREGSYAPLVVLAP